MTDLGIATPLSASGRFIVDAHGKRVRLAGVNWYGAHEDLGVAPGLDRTDRRALARAIAMQGFNSVRLPFSLWMTEQVSPVPDQYLAANPDLAGATPMQVYDACVQALTGEDLIVIPNCHILDPGWCCSEDDGNGLWYNRHWPATKFFAAWQDIAARYRANPLVAAMDIMNEPRRTTARWRVLTPTWGTRPKTDVAAMYATAGNFIHQISPHVLIICEGLNYAADLSGVARHPVRLERPGQVVYSLHDYAWFHPAGQPRQAYFDQMRRSGGYILSEQIAPVWVGEFGNDTRSLASFGLAHPRSATPAPPCGGTTSRPGSPTTTWTGAGGRSTRHSPRAPSRLPAGTGPTGATPSRGACWPRIGAASRTRECWTC